LGVKWFRQGIGVVEMHAGDAIHSVNK